MYVINADLHIHSKYSGATSQNMDIPHIAPQAAFKGLGLVGTGDCLHPGWLSHIRKTLDVEMRYEDVAFILTDEIEDEARVHHLLIFPEYGAVESAFASFKSHSGDIEKEGRCRINLSGEEIADVCSSHGILLGASHAFTPWTSVYKEYDSLAECYGKNESRVDFVELGLSADTDMADKISELREKTFLTNSDAHSPWPHRLGREFNRLNIKQPTFEEVKMALRNERGRKVIANIGIDPRLGKYHRTACSRCYTHFTEEEAEERKWRCTCGGLIKKGVAERVSEIADQDITHPSHRPPYIKIPPLSEIISETQGYSDVCSEKVQSLWRRLVSQCRSEINVLLGAEYEDIEKISNEKIASTIKAFREGNYIIVEGGGGKYGQIKIGEKQNTLDRW